MKLYTLIALFFCSCLSFAQVSPQTDSLRLPTDSLRVDSLASRRDTTAASVVDSVVTYSSADSIVYSMSTKTMTLFNKAQINYRQMQLKSEQIHINWNTSTMTANGIPDTADTTKKKFKNTPIMKDGGEEYHGFELSYNFKSKKGKIDVGDTHMDEGYYHGEEIKKAGPDVLFVADGRYTTCDASEPHYYFASPKMKVITGDKVVAEPVYLYIADVPLFALPFGVFPNHGGRRSGIIAPAIVEDATHGRLLHHLGYYWAISDYMDANLRTDLYTKGSWALYSDYRYNLRYYFNGSVSGQYKKLIAGETSDPGRRTDESYQLNFTHNQDIDPTTRMNVNFTFASNNSYLNTIDIQQGLNQLITSNATLSKSWEGTPNSMSLNISRQQNLQNGNITEVLPAISFNHSQSYPFRFGKSVSEGGGAWYEQIGFSYSASAANNRAKLSVSVDSIKTNINGKDTIGIITDFQRNRSQVITQNVGLGISPKLGYITISPSLSYSDQRIFSDNDVPVRQGSDSSLIFTKVKDSQRSGFISSGIAASTKLFGMLQPGIFGVAAIRHTLTPNLSFTYRKQIVGNNLGPKDMLLGLSIGNIFEMKTESGEEGKEGSKIQLLNVGAGISYNFSLDSLNFSPLHMDYRTSIGSILDIAGNASFDLYKLVQTGPLSYVRVNKFLLSEEGRLARMTDFSINLSTSLSGEKSSSSSQPANTDTTQHQPASGYYGLYREEEPDFSIPWRLSLQFSYVENKVPPNRSRSASVRGGLEFNLTENWKFSMNGGYDLTNKEIVVPNINISRDLHCWLMNFSWVPVGTYRSYQFEIRVKASQLRDVKVTKQGSDRGIY
jgi:lipopolysaccharide assembly outer membrane protein LptD (OstA)